MRISRVSIGAFGRLEGFDTGTDELRGLVVLLGPNEAGKSTLFHFLTTALYGFHPASREGNPYIPWGTDEAGGRVELRLDDGAGVQVERRLRSGPSGKIHVQGGTEEIRNQPLPWTAHVPYAVFRQVFAVTLQDLAGLDEATWAGIQDRLVGAMGASDLEPPRKVAAQLEAEAGALWRPNRRGNQRIRDIQDAIRDLRARRGQAVDGDRRLRDIVRERDRTRKRLEEVRQERHRQRATVDRVQSLSPVRSQLRRIAALREEAGPQDVLRSLPRDPGRHLADLQAGMDGLQRRLEELASDMVEPEAAVAALGQQEQALLARADEISGLLARAAGSSTDRARLSELEQGIAEVERRLAGAADQFLTVPWTEGPAEAVHRVPHADLRNRVTAHASLREERRIRESAQGQAADPAPPAWTLPLPASLALVVVGAAVLVMGLLGGSPVPLAAGSAVLALGAVFLAQRMRLRRGHAAAHAGDVGLAELRQREERALADVKALVEGIPFLPTLVDDPGEALLGGAERLRELHEDRIQRTRAMDEIRGRTAGEEREAASLAAALGLDAGLATDTVLHVLDREHRRAERLKEAADAGARELKRLDRERRRVEEELEASRRDADALVRRLADLGDGDPDRGGEVASNRLQAALRAAELDDELIRAHPDLDDLRARIAEAEQRGESWTVDEDDLARKKAAIEGLDEELERLAKNAEALDRDALHLQQEETVDAVDSEIAALQEEEARLVLDRDRRWVLARLVREADRRFREEHQPDLVRRAGSYMGDLTGGRYTRMLVDEASENEAFHIVGPTLPAPIPLAHPISTGTLEQAYLALRLAIVDHLDRGGERLPLFVDEVFVNWDEARRNRGMDLIASVAETRQVFFFTCHPEMADKLRDRGAQVIALSEDGV